MLERRAERGLPTPALDAQPELFEDLTPVWDCFWQLNVARRSGAGGEPLSLTMTDVAAALEINGVEREERESWCGLLRAMDVAWICDTSERFRKEQEKRGSNAAGSNRRPGRHGRRG